MLLAKLAGIKSIYQYPLFTKRDNIVFTAKKFTEKFTKKSIPTQPNLHVNQSKIENAKNKYKFDSNFKHVCIGFSASGPTKRWSVEKYMKLAEDLNKNKPCKFYLAGGKNDEELFKRFSNYIF